jgi:ribosomal subunit interface protein
MIKSELATRNYQADEKMHEYLEEKLGALEKYLPRSMRGNVLAQVMLEEDPNGREDNRFVCEVVLSVNGKTMVSREGTVNMYAAIDIVEAKLKAQVGKLKQKSVLEPRRLRMIHRLIGHRDEPESEEQSAT